MTEDNDSAVRVCTRVADLDDPVPSSVTDVCSRCGAPVWVDMAQPSPYPHLQDVYVCVQCALEDPDLGRSLAESLLSALDVLEAAGLVLEEDKNDRTDEAPA